MIKVKWVHPSHLEDPDNGEISTKAVPVIPLPALREELKSIIGQAHGGAMLGGDDAYQSCLVIETKAQRLLASLGEVKDVPEIGFGNRKA